MRNQSGDETVKSSEIFIKLQITECLLAISDWSGAEAFLNQNSEYSQLGNINYIKALQSYEDQNYESVQSHGQTLLGQIPERHGVSFHISSRIATSPIILNFRFWKKTRYFRFDSETKVEIYRKQTPY